MKVSIKAFTYTGANFRGIADDEDDLPIKAKLVGEEPNIIRYIRDNFSYGDDGEIMTVADLATAYAVGDEPVFDGCGACVVIKVSGKKLVDLRDDFSIGKHAWVDLGIVDVDEWVAGR